MKTRVLGLLLGGLAVAACGHEQITGSARNGWVTPTGWASATHPANVDPPLGVDRNTTARYHGTYDSRFDDSETAPSDFGRVPPPVLQASAAQRSLEPL